MTAAIALFRTQQALSAYQNTGAPNTGAPNIGAPGQIPAPGGTNDFGNLLSRALGGAIQDGQTAEALSTQAISGHGDLTQVVTAVSRAELALQTTVAVRDRVLQAYQDIIKMPI